MSIVRGGSEIGERRHLGQGAGRDRRDRYRRPGDPAEQRVDFAAIDSGNKAGAVEHARPRRHIPGSFSQGTVAADAGIDVPAGVATDRCLAGGQADAILPPCGCPVRAGVGIQHGKFLLEDEVDHAPSRGFSILRRRLGLQHRQPLKRLRGVGQDRLIEARRLAVDQNDGLIAAAVEERRQPDQQFLDAVGPMAGDFVFAEFALGGYLGFAITVGGDDDFIVGRVIVRRGGLLRRRHCIVITLVRVGVGYRAEPRGKRGERKNGEADPSHKGAPASFSCTHLPKMAPAPHLNRPLQAIATALRSRKPVCRIICSGCNPMLIPKQKS
ncbi:hypothetical protein [Sphingopyxis sp.]|uniref:hypothetical protein n=1 Tax=Sphingopyxis sp. TaxID=1908224 RepID=UPI002ED7BC98